MEIDGKSYPAVWWDPDKYPGEPVFLVIQDGALGVIERDLIVEWAQNDRFNDGVSINETGQMFYIKEPGRNALDLVKLTIEDRRADEDSKTRTPHLVVNNLVTFKEHVYGLA